LAVAPPALAAPSVVSESASQITASDATLEATIATQPAEDVITQFQLATSPEGLSPEFQCPREWVKSSLCLELHGETPLPVQDVEPPGGTVSVSLAGRLTLSPSTTYYYRILAAKTKFGGDVFVVEPPVVYGAIQSFTTPAPSPPTVTHVEPNLGSPSGGTTVTITGTELTGATAVKFGSTNAASFKVNSDKTITAVSPAGAGTVDVTVTTPLGTSPASEADHFGYGPVVTKVEPSYGPPSGGTSVTITGSNFAGATAVKFGSTNAASFTVNSESSITAVSPAGTGTVDVTVTTPGGISATSPTDQFAYGPVLTKIEPNRGIPAGGTSVAITGTNFTGATAVKFGSTNAASFTVNSDTSITAVAPAGTGTVDITVETSAGTSLTSSADRYSFIQPAPTVGVCVVPEPTQTTATLCATVNPNGGEVSGCEFEFGPTTAYGLSVPCTPSPGSGTSPVTVTATISGLTPNTIYHFRVVATNAGGVSHGSDLSVKTLPNPPTVVTGTASSITSSSATLNATVNPNGGEVSGCKFEYGATTAYGSSAACVPSPGSVESPVAVSASVSGLSPNTTYHFRIAATNRGGTSSGSDQTTLLLSGPTFATSFTPESEGSFNQPDAVALDPSGNIWVADSGHDRVLEFNKERKFLTQFGVEGTGEGQFEGVASKGIAGIATNSSGDVYVTGSDRVQEFSPTGAFLRQWGSPGSGNGQFLYPNGIAVDTSGNVWVVDTFNNRVQEFSESGAYLGQFGTKGTENGQLFWPSGLAFSGGNVYVADSARVEEFSTAGTYLGQFGSSGTGNGEFHGIRGIASEPTTGDLYISDTYNNRVQVFSSAGNFITAFGLGGSGNGEFSAPRGVAVNSSGTAYVADTGNNRAQEWVGGP
jgi:sugar lactone lactonase YvrE